MDSALDLNSSPNGPNRPLKATLSPAPDSDRRIYQGSLQPKGFPTLPAGWSSDWETFPSSDGALQLYGVTHHAKEWAAESNPGRVLLVAHGMGEHGGRYLHFPYYVQSEVSAVYCLDHRGHGRSEGLRGHVENFDLFADDMALAVKRLDEALKKRFGKSEIHVLGHSMGGLITLRMLFKHKLPLASVSVSAPLLGIKMEVPFVKKMVGKALSRVWGSLQMTSEIDAAVLSHDKEVVAVYESDRLIHQKVTPKFFVELENAMADAMKRNSGFEYPLQMLIPLQDKVVNSDLSLEFFRSLKLRDKMLKTYPELFHEPFNEIGKEQVFSDLLSWMREHRF